MKKLFTLFLMIVIISGYGQTSMLNLPFTEDFSQTLSTNNWTVVGGINWRISATLGDPAPCVIFYGTSTNYEMSLESDNLNGSAFTSGAIFFDFSMMISAKSATGTEILTIELDNGSGWKVLDEFDNSNGGSSWRVYHYDITNQASLTNFKIRFRAHGSNFADMNAWAIDNVKVAISPLGVEEDEVTIAKIYPNPTNGQVNFQLYENIKSVVIYDLLGCEKLSIDVPEKTSLLKSDVSELRKGIYLVKLLTESGKIATRRLVID